MKEACQAVKNTHTLACLWCCTAVCINKARTQDLFGFFGTFCSKHALELGLRLGASTDRPMNTTCSVSNVCVCLFAQVEHNDAYSTWSLTDEGLGSVCSGSKLSSSRLASNTRMDIERKDRDPWELLTELRSAGWVLSIVCLPKHQKQLEPYKVGSAKLLYGRENGITSRSYLLCLLCAGREKLVGIEIPHFKADTYYADLLEGRDPASRVPRRKRTCKFEGNPRRLGALLGGTQPGTDRMLTKEAGHL